MTVGGVAHAVGAAIGVALSPQDAGEMDELLRKADVALYRAKAERVSAVRFFEPAMDARLQERAELERACARRSRPTAWRCGSGRCRTRAPAR